MRAPRRRRSRPFATDPEREFTFYLADRLKMTVGDMEARMGNKEFVEWAMYHAHRAQKRELAEKKSKRR